MQCPTVSWRCFEHNSGTASIDVHSATFCVFSFFMCFDIWSNTMFGTLIRGFCLSATTESGQSRWQPLLCSKLDAAGVQAVSTLRIDESPKNGAMLQDVLPGIGQMMPDGGVLLFTFLWISEYNVWLLYLKISSRFCLHKLLVCALWFAALCCFARTSQHFGLPLALRHKTPHFHCLAEKVNAGRC